MSSSDAESLGLAVGMFILALIGNLILAAIGVWLWGIIAVSIFGLPSLTYWQFYGLLILIRILLPKRNVKINKEN